MLPQYYPINLNQLDKVKEALETILHRGEDEESIHTIFLFEAIMLYLEEGVPSALLGVCREALTATKQQGSLCFADGLENVPGVDKDTAAKELAHHGWKLVEWLPKGSKTKHMGRAEIIPEQTF